MVEVVRQCSECKQEFTQEFSEPVNWHAVNSAVSAKEPRCKEHTKYFTFNRYPRLPLPTLPAGGNP